MIINTKVRGSMETVQPLEVGIDTVYIRSNITKVETIDFIGWEYDEVQYDLKEYIKLISENNNSLVQQISDINITLANMMGGN